MTFRAATSQDCDGIRRVHRAAFPEEEGEIIAKLAMDLLSEDETRQIISLVAEMDGMPVGHIAFSPVTIDKNENFRGYILAPLGVKPEYQKRRIGTGLIQRGIKRISDMGANVIFVYGDPKYYARFGFSPDAAHKYTAPYRLQYPLGWQAIVLNECDAGKEPVSITCVASLSDPKLW